MGNGLEEKLSQGQAPVRASATERRGSPRMRTLKEGKRAYHDQFCAVDCVLRDISDGGARVVMQGFPLSQKDLMLHVPMDGYMVPVRRAWAEGEMWGLAFTGPRQPTRIARSQVISDDRPPPLARPRAKASDDMQAVPASPQARKPFGRRV